MNEQDATFDYWRNTFYKCSPDDSMRLTAFQQMFVSAKTFGQWLNIYYEADNEHMYPLRLKALNALMKLADDPKDAIWCDKPKVLRL